VIRTLPGRDADGGWPAAAFRSWRWPNWTEPAWHAVLKPVYDSLRVTWAR
jgi:hypothetical protein